MKRRRKYKMTLQIVKFKWERHGCVVVRIVSFVKLETKSVEFENQYESAIMF